jgi:hypothetical protein
VIVSVRVSIAFLLLLLLILQADAKNKKKQLLSDYVLKAQRVFVMVHPDAGEPLTQPTANRTAQDDVEKAMMKWGRFNLVMEAQTADLVIAVRKGHAGGPTIMDSPADNRSVVYQRSVGDIRVGGQQGRPPDLTNPSLGPSEDRGPRLGSQIGSSEDSFEVYLGGVEYPLDTSPIWRYMAKDALSGPQVSAVEQFRKAIDESEKQRQHKP